jgi:hypothetical protein
VGWKYIEKIVFRQADPANPKGHHESTLVEYQEQQHSTGQVKGGKDERIIMIVFFRAFRI